MWPYFSIYLPKYFWNLYFAWQVNFFRPELTESVSVPAPESQHGFRRTFVRRLDQQVCPGLFLYSLLAACLRLFADSNG